MSRRGHGRCPRCDLRINVTTFQRKAVRNPQTVGEVSRYGNTSQSGRARDRRPPETGAMTYWHYVVAVRLDAQILALANGTLFAAQKGRVKISPATGRIILNA